MWSKLELPSWNVRVRTSLIIGEEELQSLWKRKFNFRIPKPPRRRPFPSSWPIASIDSLNGHALLQKIIRSIILTIINNHNCRSWQSAFCHLFGRIRLNRFDNKISHKIQHEIRSKILKLRRELFSRTASFGNESRIRIISLLNFRGVLIRSEIFDWKALKTLIRKRK